MKKSINALFAICTILLVFSCSEKSNKSSDLQNTKEAKPVANEEFIGVYSFLKAENKDTTIVRLNFLSDDEHQRGNDLAALAKRRRNGRFEGQAKCKKRNGIGL